MKNKIQFYDIDSKLLQCLKCGYIWKPLVKDTEITDPDKYLCPICKEVRN